MEQKSPKFEQAFNLHQEGKLTQARDLYKELLVQEPQNHEVWDLLGLVFLQASEYEKSLECIKRAIDIFPDPYYIQNIGKLYFEMKDFENSIAIY